MEADVEGGFWRLKSTLRIGSRDTLSHEAATTRTSLTLYVASVQQIRGSVFEICVSKCYWTFTRLVLKIKLVINLGLKCGGLELSRSHTSLAHITGLKPSLLVKFVLMYCR